MQASARKSWILRLGFTLTGMLVGYLLVHPLAMLAYTLGPHHARLTMDFSFWARELRLAFSLGMVHMGVAFAVMGGVAGLFLGLWYDQKERWIAEKLESERRLAALKTLRDLMVTLAHYIRNSNMVIGGFSSHLLKHIADVDFAHKLQMVQQASREIEVVLNSLQNLTEISTVQYATEGQARMIDLKKELEAHLSRSATTEQHEP